jgi:hypothetical protein
MNFIIAHLIWSSKAATFAPLCWHTQARAILQDASMTRRRTANFVDILRAHDVGFERELICNNGKYPLGLFRFHSRISFPIAPEERLSWQR